MKVFEFNLNGESYTVAAPTLLYAIRVMSQSDEILINELDESDTVKEVPQEKWAEMKIKDVDTGEVKSVAELISNSTPQILGSSAYLF